MQRGNRNSSRSLARQLADVVRYETERTSAMISRIASTKVGTAHIPCASFAHPLMPVRGDTPSLTMMRSCGSGFASQERTIRLSMARRDTSQD